MMIPRGRYRRDDLITRTRSVTVCIPARDEVATIGHTVSALVALRDAGALDAVMVLGGGSSDRTDSVAADAGATVCDTSVVLADFGPVLGKGDAMWRGLSTVATDVVVFIDADLLTDLEAMVCGLAGPLVAADAKPDARFVKGAFRRHHPDFITDEDPYDGGRVTETAARPLINLLRPDLADFYQPLGGQIAADVALLRRIGFFTGYAVEIAMLVDVVDLAGRAAVVQSDLGDLENRPRTTTELAPMAQEVIFGFLASVRPEAVAAGWQPYVRPRYGGGFDTATAAVARRPPLDSLAH